jgi:superfamily II DNA or RNA helicase
LSLRELAIRDEYRSDRCDLIEDFYIPCLEQATVYSRAVGFFSSTSMIAVSRGLTALIRAGGTMRLVASPCLSSEDIEAIATGLKQRDEVITEVILQKLDREFEEVAKDRLACLAWLLSQEILEIKLAIPRNIRKQGIYHEKLGLFTDIEDNKLAFTGSANESSSALIDNFECIDVFCSWKAEEQKRALRKAENFERLWDNQTSKVEVMRFPEAAARSLLRLKPDKPPSTEPEYKSKKKYWSAKEEKSNYNVDRQSSLTTTLKYKTWLQVELRPLQVDALEGFIAANYKGILAMATGAGKTITALACAASFDDLDLIVIGVPTKELVQQWVNELEGRTTFQYPLVATGKSEIWRSKLFRKLRLINNNQLSRERLPVIVVGIYSELSKFYIADLIVDAGSLPERSLLIADEVHATGAGSFRRILRDDFTYRLGLSATPIRPHDEEGTEVILDYFGGIVYEFSLEQAIADGILCEYEYQVYVTSLDDSEHETFKQLTSKINRLRNSEDERAQAKAKHLLIQRAKIIKSASSKLTILDRILDDHPPQKSMIYCADLDQATTVSWKLAQKGIRVARYSSQDKERQKILSQFSRGHLDALVAVKCLDEGVDVPETSQAIILASDTSERQFIQRRGRILRAAPNKAIATLIDVLVVPPLGDEDVKLITSEVRRVTQFANAACNRNIVIAKLVKKLTHYGITYSDLV